MITQIDYAKKGRITPEMEAVALEEDVNVETLRENICSGSAIIMKRGDRCIGIGKGLRTKINVNIGTSSARIDVEEEIEKAKIAEKYGADTLSDLSMGGDIDFIRKKIFENTTLPITTVPIYQTAAVTGLPNMDSEDLLATIKSHIDQGVSSIVLHCIDRNIIRSMKDKKRIMGIVSKGGSLTFAYMMKNKCENPFIENFDKILDMMRRKDVVLSLGNAMRSGCIHDAMDAAQVAEIELNAKIAREAHERGVAVIIEGCGGHVHAGKIQEYIKFYKAHADFPLFVAGPLPADIAVGHDHIAGCVGAGMASGAGADYLCYITPAEHLGLPKPVHVKEGLIAFKIAAHIGDSIKYGPSKKDRCLAEKRAELDWQGQMDYALDSERAKEICPADGGPCTMCGDYCAIKIMRSFERELWN